MWKWIYENEGIGVGTICIDHILNDAIRAWKRSSVEGEFFSDGPLLEGIAPDS